MTRATLNPPPAPARAPEKSGVVPHVPVRAPFTRGGRERGGRITPRGVALSAGAHLLLALAVWLAPVRVVEAPREAGRAGDPAGAVSYVDIGAWPGGAEGGQPAAAPSAEAGAVATQAPADTATARAAAPRLDNFPRRAPAGIPPAPRAGAGAAGGAPSGPGAAPGGTPGAAGGAPGAGRGGPAGGRLGSELGDGRLVVTPEAAPERPMTDRERLRARIAARIGAINDSIADEAARERRARNWTIKDRNGREWGIAEGGAPVVAGVKIPGVRVTPPGGRSREAELHDAEAKRQRDEIGAQADAQDRDQNMRERTRATRERLDRERRQKREGAPGNP
ncbi:MAG TPA: hypothetical protein VF613_05865 [Longimicrobium sp.]